MHPQLEEIEQLVQIMKSMPVKPAKLTYNLPDQCVTINGKFYHSLTIMFIQKNHKGHLVGFLGIKDEEIVEVTYDKGCVEWVKYNGKRVYDGEEYDWNPPNH